MQMMNIFCSKICIEAVEFGSTLIRTLIDWNTWRGKVMQPAVVSGSVVIRRLIRWPAKLFLHLNLPIIEALS